MFEADIAVRRGVLTPFWKTSISLTKGESLTASVEQIFRDLVRIPSASLREGAVAEYCRQYLRSQGFQVNVDNCGKRLGAESGNLIASLPGDPNLDTVLLSGHMDTVGGGLVPEGIRVIRGVCSGDGNIPLGADDKVGIAIILATAARMARIRRSRPTLQIIFTIAEELGMQGIRCLSSLHLKKAVGLTLDGEGPPGTLYVYGPAMATWEAELSFPVYTGAETSTSHIAKRGLGGSTRPSVLPLIEVMRALRANFESGVHVSIDGFQVLDHGFSPLHRWRIYGHVSVNPNKSSADVLGQLQSVLRTHPRVYKSGTSFHSDLICHGFEFSAEHPSRLRAERAIQECGLSVVTRISNGGSDANWFTYFGIPTLNLGIGVARAHSLQESIRIKDMKIMVDVVCSFCANRS